MIFKNKKTKEKKYKFKSLKVYSSEEWLAEGKKKYRQVFEQSETAYLYAELAFYNKAFDTQSWDVNVKLICYKITRDGKEVICDLNLDPKVHPEENTVFVREGWGHEQLGYFWHRGEYLWEAFLDNELVGTAPFYVEDSGQVTLNYNPYFELSQIALFEGGHEGLPQEKRVYLKQFQAAETRYVWVELRFENMIPYDWHCELLFNFYNSAGELKGKTTELRTIRGEEDDVTIITGWGSDNKGTWYQDQYTLEIVFMNRLIAIVPFECGSHTMEGDCTMLLGEALLIEKRSEENTDTEKASSSEETLEQAMQELSELIGLKQVKKKIKEYTQYLEFLKLRREKGFDEDERSNLHAVFTGNPGTGKTTVAKLLAKIYHHLGFLSEGSIVEVGRAELIGQYIGQTAPKVKEMIESARGGVLFIDEAYSLVRSEDDDKDYGQEVIEVLVKEMSDGPGDIAIFLAGYPEEMQLVLNSNPGFKSRFGTTFHFPDYLPQELLAIAAATARKKEIAFEPEAMKFLERKLIEEYRNRDKSFGNARLVCSWVDEVKMKMGLRIMQSENPSSLSKEELSTATMHDLETLFKATERKIPILGVDEEELKEQLDLLNSLVGVQTVKNEIHELIRLVRFYLDTQQDVLGSLSLHAVFKGNPGTGKTTIARILARIYKALGLLEKGHLVECSRKDLVAGYVGQTALKTQKMLEKAKGGVLFIDEAYALNSDTGGQDFGKEAIEVILKEMEDHRGDLAIIVAGYTQEMDDFLRMNPGLQSRFDKLFFFADFSSEELYRIAIDMLQDKQLSPDQHAAQHMRTFFTSLRQSEKRYFGNARDIRKFIEQAVRNQHLRISTLSAEMRTRKQMTTLELADVEHIQLSDADSNRPIGFSQSSS